ncbi:lysis protein [Pantoea rodasii]|uniref:Lysis protein n=1 Tax=Pantoea rodasii TaxID=1076549 RepID=A0A2M9WBU5_9GAMM|nr:lysis protein [Pantoea rodasii]ORM64525.1 lysis protein [Pantoea rodasii]PJZ04997.1 lysis protein [Pantoea rodasii]
MTSKAKALIVFVVVCLIAIVSASSLALYYRGNAIEYKAQRDTATDKLKLANDTITDMTTRQREIAALDAKYTKELADAKARLEALQQCVNSGKCGLRLNAKCPAGNTTGTASVDYAASPRLTDSAQRDYFTLRERIEIAGKQIAGLQQFISEQCLR